MLLLLVLESEDDAVVVTCFGFGGPSLLLVSYVVIVDEEENRGKFGRCCRFLSCRPCYCGCSYRTMLLLLIDIVIGIIRNSG